MRDQSLAANIGKPEQYVTVYSGMDTAAFINPPSPRAEVRTRLGLREEDIAVGTIARLFHLKGHETLLNLAPELCQDYPNLRFLWVGDGLLRSHFEDRIRYMKLQDRFIFTGLVDPSRIPELANAMDIVVHPSQREGLARAIVQGQLARAPVVAYDIDGNREGLIHGETGFVVRPFKASELEEGLRELLNDPEKRRAMGEAGRAFALGRFDAKVMVDALERVYADARARATL
jgi:glycosyltransferase involved in cell wall biosynthesis